MFLVDLEGVHGELRGDLVEAVEVELLGDREGLGQADQHALVALEVRLRGGAGADDPGAELMQRKRLCHAASMPEPRLGRQSLNDA